MLHRVPNSVAHKPSRFVGAAQSSVQLVSAHSLFRRAHLMEGNAPMAERYMRPLEDGFHSHGELLAAFLCLALIDARTCGAAFQKLYFLAATVRANSALWPADRFKVLASAVFVQFRDLREIHCRVPFD